MTRHLRTAVGVLLTAVMLFPVYWMINVSFTKDTDMRASPPHLFPFDDTIEGYRAVLDQRLPYLGTSLLVGLGTVVLTVVLAAPAGYALAKLRPAGGPAISFILLIAQMIPGIIMAMGFYAIYLKAGVLFTAFMAGIPDELSQAAAIYHYIGNNNQQWNAIMATAVVASVPATILLIIAQRYVAAGVTAGAVKD
ncbi:hypothetical protein GCM10020358_71970 [Amorphoplanes nipponensis]|uniref:ABC transmembrane type-1 domain-containing protein n=1 Tax=Actinoplanes nipponensis TaxID=135950 RepID=A0A919MF07_9ACTN|nr:carbohydrate ABC transporter permease [Actinoplanes nipponensis]GIE47014.1 hypothetical protein Ani05nite_05480 [Actinoplanes nipponensis]